MSKIGFVYILVNDHMPDVYKVGCTERSPHERAAELSGHTSVPAPFRVLCFAEFDDFQAMERRFHEWLAQWRISPQREFFKGGMGYAVRLLYWNRSRLSFTVPCSPESDWVQSPLTEVFGKEFAGLEDTGDPWAPKLEQPTTDPAVAKVVETATAAAASGFDDMDDDIPF